MKSISTFFAIVILAFFLSTPTFAKDTQERMAAIEHVEEAIKHGKMGHAKELMEHAQVSKQHTQEAIKLGGDAHMSEAAVHLDEAIKHAEMGHADEATKHAEEALSHMKQSGVRDIH